MSSLIRKSPQATHPGLPPVILTVAGFGAAFAAASCCALPLFLSAVGLGSAGLVGLAMVAAPHRELLLVAGAACLGAAAVLLWRQGRTARSCAAGDVCSRTGVRRLTISGLTLGCILLVLGYVYA